MEYGIIVVNVIIVLVARLLEKSWRGVRCMLKVDITALGNSIREEYCNELENNRALNYEEKVLVLPNHTLMEEVQKKHQVLCMSLDTLARKIINKNENYKKYDVINRRRQELLVASLIEDKKENLSYFTAVLDKPGFVKAMTTLISQLSRSGLTEKEVDAFLECWEGKDPLQDKVPQIKNFYKEYLNTLKKDRGNGRQWFDIEGQYRLAIKTLEDEKVKLPWKKIYLSDFYSFDMLQLEFIRKLINLDGLDVKIGMPFEKERNAVFGAVANTVGFLVGIEHLKGKVDNYNKLEDKNTQKEAKKQATDFRDQIADNLWRENGAYQKMSTDSVFLNAFKSRDEEMRWALSKIKELLRCGASEDGEIQNGVAPSDIIVAVRKLNNYTGLRQIADEYGIPVSLPKTMALSSHPVAEFVQLLLDAALPNKKGADAYFAVLKCPWSKLFTQCETDGISSLRENKLYTSPAAVRQDLPENVAADGFVQIINEYIDAIGDKHTLREHYELLQDVFTKLSVETSLGALYKEQKLALQSLQASILTKSSLLHCASALVEDYEACGHGESKYTAQEWQELLVEAMQSENIVLERGRQDGVKITEVINLQGLTRPYVFILGMREHEFPSIENNEWIYNDLDRLEMIQYGIELPVKAMQFSEDAWFFAAAAVVAQKELYLSWHEDSEAGKSPYIEGIMQLFDGLQLKKGEDKLPASLEEFERKGLLCDKEWLEDKLQSAAVLTTAVKADVARNDKDADAYNGVLAEQIVIQQAKNAAGKRFSASTLEKYAACPFQFLGEKIWSKKEVTEQEEEVAATSKGTLLHNTLAAFVKTYLQKKISQNDLGMLEVRLNSIFEEECKKLVGDKIVDNELWKLEKQRIWQTLRRWLRFECAEQEAWQNYTPQAVEWNFEPVELVLENGDKVSLIGRIDRLDGDGEYIFITDYKQSTVPKDNALDNGLDMQMPIYMLAVNQSFAGGKKITGESYLDMKKFDHKPALVFVDTGNEKLPAPEGLVWEQEKDKYEKVIKDYISAIYAGKFMVAPKKCSDYCRLKDICRKSVLVQVEQEVQGDE